MFGKITPQYIRRQFNNAKTNIGNSYTKTKHFLNSVDDGFKVAKKAYSILSPTISALAGDTNFGKIHKHVMGAVSGYDNIRNSLVDTDNTIQHHVKEVKTALKKTPIDIGL